MSEAPVLRRFTSSFVIPSKRHPVSSRIDEDHVELLVLPRDYGQAALHAA